MKEYDVLIADPAGNITAMVLNDVERKDYMFIANKLMEMKEYGIEQVGFVKNPEMGGELRLEMMGGEFCGNATRSFGFYLAKKKEETGYKKVIVEISGCSNNLEVNTDVKNNYARTEMPLPKEINYISIDNRCFPVIVFEGIVHVIAENVQENNELYEEVKQAIINKYICDAFGIMFFNTEKLQIVPVVYVRETNTVVYENSCGSGSLATAVYLSKDNSDGIYSYDISNPKGIIEVQVYKQDGKITKATIGGKVFLSNIYTFKF